MAPSSKDAAAFSSVVNSYENGDLKNALVEVDRILKRSPKYGDAILLKALILYKLNRKDEAKPLVEQGISEALDSDMAFQMAGIYYKLEKNYPEAYKYMVKSYNMDPESFRVRHDLSMLAIQQRQYGVLVDVRRRMLGERPQIHMLWFGLAVAQYMAADPSGALKTLELFEKLLETESKVPVSQRTPMMEVTSDIEVSELVLFKVRCIEATGNYKAALKELEQKEAKIMDKLTLQEKRAKFLHRLGETEKATQAYRDLIKRNPDNAKYYEPLESLLGVTDSPTKRLALHAALAKKYPRAELPKLRPLSFLSGDALAEHLQMYIEAKLARGVPSCFAFVKQVYRSNYDVCKRVGDIIMAQPTPETADAKAAKAIFVARHLSYTNRHKEALEVVDAGLAEFADMAELALAKAKVLSRQGDLAAAAAVLEDAAQKDPGDRFLNAKAAKYAAQANDVAKSVEIASIFPIAGLHTKDGIRHLTEMQSVDYLVPLAEAYARVGDHGLALKIAEGVAGIFQTYTIDQYDFHYYGPRRGNVNAYIDLLHWEDSLYSHPQYLRAAKVAITEYIALATKEDDGLDAEELAKRKAERIRFLKERENDSPFIPKGLTEAETLDDDPFGYKYLENRTPLDEAFRLWKPLETSSPTRVSTWELAFEIYLAQNKYVLAVQSIKKAKELDASPDWIAYAAVRARHQLEQDTSAPEVIRLVQLKMLPSIAPKSIETSDLTEFTDAHVTDVLLWAKARHALNRMDGVEQTLIDKAIGNPNLCAELVRLLRKWRVDLSKFTAAVKEQWPLASFL